MITTRGSGAEAILPASKRWGSPPLKALAQIGKIIIKIDPSGALKAYLKLLDKLRDRLVVTDCMDTPLGFWGSDNARAAVNHGTIGFIIYGGIRDSAEVKREGIKVWSTYRTCLHLWPRLKPMDISDLTDEKTIRCAGVAVNPGEIICADDDEVIVVPLDKAEKVLSFAKSILKWAQKTRRQNYIDAGMPFDSTLGNE